jgi:hypothetical protein
MLPTIGFPRWIHWTVTAGVAIFSALEWIKLRWRAALGSLLVLACSAGLTWAGATTIPPASRHAMICAALGADDDCSFHELGHLKAHVTLIAFDPSAPGEPWRPIAVLAKIRGRTVALSLMAAPEADLRATIDDPATRYDDLLVDAAAWPDLRALARLETGVPIVRDAQRTLSPRVQETPDDAMGTVRSLKVRIALVGLND